MPHIPYVDPSTVTVACGLAGDLVLLPALLVPAGPRSAAR